MKKQESAWEDLYPKVRRWAYNFFLKKGFYANDPGTLELTEAAVVDSFEAILSAKFPYDVDFDPWLVTIVKNHCRRQIRKGLKESQVPEKAKVEIDNQPFFEIAESDKKLREDLFDAIEAIPNANWQEVLIYKLNGLLPNEIAAEMNKTPSAVYNMQSKALKKLREIWTQKGYNDDKQ